MNNSLGFVPHMTMGFLKAYRIRLAGDYQFMKSSKTDKWVMEMHRDSMKAINRLVREIERAGVPVK